jgi:hypothetical protein
LIHSVPRTVTRAGTIPLLPGDCVAYMGVPDEKLEQARALNLVSRSAPRARRRYLSQVVTGIGTNDAPEC